MHWQKEPLLVRSALPDFEHAFSRREVFELAGHDDVESRLVQHNAGRWQVQHGPFRLRDLQRLPETRWTLLVQGVENHLPAARALLTKFAFIPYARQDDVMVSVAPPGGGVGPHFDSYDVFLLQVTGRRLWRLSAQADLRLAERAPLKLLRRFRREREEAVDPGDLLYLPPRYAHDGVAATACITCSIGFRAPSAQEIGAGFLQWLQDDLQLEGLYHDPDLQPQARPAQLSSAMLAQVERMLAQVQWDRSSIERFLGSYLTEPKPQIWFDAPRPALALRAFAAQAHRLGVRLAPKTRMLHRGRYVFINGETIEVPVAARDSIRALADRRAAIPWPRGCAWADRRLHLWYRDGYVQFA